MLEEGFIKASISLAIERKRSVSKRKGRSTREKKRGNDGNLNNIKLAKLGTVDYVTSHSD